MQTANPKRLSSIQGYHRDADRIAVCFDLCATLCFGISAIAFLFAGDEDLLPAALAILANIHAKGVIHGDLREENFLINEADVGKGGAKTVVLFDFSHCSFNVGEEDQGKEVDEMKVLSKSL